MDHVHLFNTVFCEHCGFQLSVPVYCKNRFCSVCSHHRNRVIRHKLHTFIADRQLRKYDGFKFLTLTIQSQPDLQVMTTELIKSFRRLRQRAFWRKNVRGGAFVVEVKRGKDGWHVHLHIVIESQYLPYKVLLAEWSAVSTGIGVYIKKLHNSQVISYLTKYLTKDQATKADQIYMTEVLKGVRLFQPFGSWHGPITKMKPLKFGCPVCTRVDWVFGDRDIWFNGLLPEAAVDKRISDGLRPTRPKRQEKLSLSADSMIVNVD